MAELTTAEKAAYQASFNRTKKQAARDKGAADAGGSALERARQRALGGGEPVARASVQPAKQQSQRIIQQPDGSRVPEAFYSLSPEQQREFKRLVKEQENLASGETHFDRVSLAVLDQQAAQAKRITDLERLVESLVGENMELRRRQDNIDLTVEVTKSDALVEAESQLAQTIVNAGTVKAQLDSATASSAREMEVQQADHRARFEASERVLGDMEGRLNSTGTLYQERGNAVVSQWASIEGRVAKAEVSQIEIDNGIKANRDTLRAATGDDLKSVVDMGVKQAFDDRLDGAMEELIQRKYVLLAPTNGTDGYDPKRDDLTKPFLAEQVGDNPTERAVNRALRNKR